ncbi:ester cyclase [Microbacterium sp. Sa4CUA7]|uniref:Ester cyclase n=1 Tax=Microbacterium pullorum TaxID=2762236 RepID=A0ABR8S2R0_9MICO|nr:ester cyclase [Microbacterium pullorum]MBD7957758.1 ester cyclase [Microbacterium pullorum]
MNTEEKRSVGVEVLERMLHEGFATGNTDIVDELCSPHLVEHQFGLAGSGAEAIAKVKRGIADVHRGMPDLRFTVEDWAESGDIAWVRAEGTATNTGPFFGPPTGKAVHFTVIDIARVQGGLIVEHWGVPDRFAILLRMGRLPIPASESH